MSEQELTKEEQILGVMRKVLTGIAKDTYTKPGLKHPLSEDTIIGIRDCLSLISAREKELADEHGRGTSKKPAYIDEPQQSVVIPLHKIGRSKKPGDDTPDK